MPDTAARTDAINVQDIMEQLRARIREKRGSDAADGPPQAPGGGTRAFSDGKDGAELLTALRQARTAPAAVEIPSYSFEDYTLFESTRGPLRFVRRLLLPLLKLFFNPNPLIQALNTQTRINAFLLERDAARERAHAAFEQAQYDALQALIAETAHLGGELKRLGMQMESTTSRLEFNEKRARAIESATVYRPAPEDRVEPTRDTRRDEPRREDPRRDEPRREDFRRDDARREEVRREDTRRDSAALPREPREGAPAAFTPAAPAQPPSQGASPAPNGEGTGARGRRRRRRRGRRGAGQAPVGSGVPTAAALPGEATEPGASMDVGAHAAEDSGGDDAGDWDAGDSADTPEEPGTPPDRVDSDPSDQGQ
jgi:hypothetical protein